VCECTHLSAHGREHDALGRLLLEVLDGGDGVSGLLSLRLSCLHGRRGVRGLLLRLRRLCLGQLLVVLHHLLHRARLRLLADHAVLHERILHVAAKVDGKLDVEELKSKQTKGGAGANGSDAVAEGGRRRVPVVQGIFVCASFFSSIH